MEWNEENKARIYAAIYAKIEDIKGEFETVEATKAYYLIVKKYSNFLDSCGMLRVRWKKSKKTPPHWISHPNNPANTENNFIIPDPFYACNQSPHPFNNDEKNLGICIPKETAEKILVLGLP
jgi:hypothetical protein